MLLQEVAEVFDVWILKFVREANSNLIHASLEVLPQILDVFVYVIVVRVIAHELELVLFVKQLLLEADLCELLKHQVVVSFLIVDSQQLGMLIEHLLDLAVGEGFLFDVCDQEVETLEVHHFELEEVEGGEEVDDIGLPSVEDMQVLVNQNFNGLVEVYNEGIAILLEVCHFQVIYLSAQVVELLH